MVKLLRCHMPLKKIDVFLGYLMMLFNCIGYTVIKWDDDHQVDKDLETGGHGLFQDNILTFTWRD